MPNKKARQNSVDSRVVTSIFVDRICMDAVDEFESWLQNIHKDARQAAGFVDVSTVRTDSAEIAEFVTLLSFADQNRLHAWVQSEQSQEWLEHLPGLLHERQSSAFATGLGPWVSTGSTPVPYWKQVVLGTITVYPSVLFLNFALKPLTGGLSNSLAILIAVFFLSVLLTWPIMPVATHVLRRWLNN